MMMMMWIMITAITMTMLMTVKMMTNIFNRISSLWQLLLPGGNDDDDDDDYNDDNYFQDFLSVAVAAPWARAISHNGVPYYIKSVF